MSLETVDRGMLPEDLRDKDTEALKAEVAKRVEERTAAQAEIQKLAKERDTYLKNNMAEAEGGFDAKVKSSLEKQLKK
jgi:flagellar biosynthesis chaperone FliJ